MPTECLFKVLNNISIKFLYQEISLVNRYLIHGKMCALDQMCHLIQQHDLILQHDAQYIPIELNNSSNNETETILKHFRVKEFLFFLICVNFLN